jgi:hypothetical protein
VRAARRELFERTWRSPCRETVISWRCRSRNQPLRQRRDHEVAIGLVALGIRLHLGVLAQVLVTPR